MATIISSCAVHSWIERLHELRFRRWSILSDWSDKAAFAGMAHEQKEFREDLEWAVIVTGRQSYTLHMNDIVDYETRCFRTTIYAADFKAEFDTLWKLWCDTTNTRPSYGRNHPKWS